MSKDISDTSAAGFDRAVRTAGTRGSTTGSEPAVTPPGPGKGRGEGGPRGSTRVPEVSVDDWLRAKVFGTEADHERVLREDGSAN